MTPTRPSSRHSFTTYHFRGDRFPDRHTDRQRLLLYIDNLFPTDDHIVSVFFGLTLMPLPLRNNNVVSPFKFISEITTIYSHFFYMKLKISSVIMIIKGAYF